VNLWKKEVRGMCVGSRGKVNENLRLLVIDRNRLETRERFSK
jgi:hypothetical protein